MKDSFLSLNDRKESFMATLAGPDRAAWSP